MAMDKRLSHLILALFDIVAVIAVYWVVHRYNNIDFALENRNSVISFNNRFFFYIGIMIVPIAHTMAIIEATAKPFDERVKNDQVERDEKHRTRHKNGTYTILTYFDDVAAHVRVDGIENLKKYFKSLEGKVPVHKYELVNPKVQVYGDMAILSLWYKGIIEGEYDHLPEQAFYMAGSIDEVIEKAKAMETKAA